MDVKEHIRALEAAKESAVYQQDFMRAAELNYEISKYRKIHQQQRQLELKATHYLDLELWREADKI